MTLAINNHSQDRHIREEEAIRSSEEMNAHLEAVSDVQGMALYLGVCHHLLTKMAAHAAVLHMAGATFKEKETKKKAGEASKKPASDANDDVYNLLFIVLMGALISKENSVTADTDLLKQDNNVQQYWNSMNDAISIQTLPPNPTPDQIKEVQAENEAATDLKSGIQSQLVTLRQGTQVDMTAANADVDSMQEDVSMDSDWLQTLSAISQVLNQMNQRTF